MQIHDGCHWCSHIVASPRAQEEGNNTLTRCRNARLHSQRGYNALASAMRSQMHWHMRAEELNPFVRFNPLRQIKYWYNGYKMNKYISVELDKRYLEWRSSRGDTSKPASKSVIDLVITGYLADKMPENGLDKEFKAWATSQLRLFLFAGHDSTAATIVYCFYLLSKNPVTLKKIREEHDKVFGPEISEASKLLKEKPQLINELPYTAAVIKEALRLFPPATGLRSGLPNVKLRGSQGNHYPTEGLTMWILHPAMHRDSKYWPEPNSFLPERWLVHPGHDMYPFKGAWRPFEYGPRNCIGQTLAMLDIKITLLMTIREFDIKDAYDEWDRLNPRSGIKSVNGERAYQISQGASHPSDGFPCRVTWRSREHGTAV
jgi:hypothetical protein